MQQKKLWSPIPIQLKFTSQTLDLGYDLTRFNNSLYIYIYIYIYIFISKIDIYKIKNQSNIKAIGKNQNETNYVAQIIINQILNDEIEKKISKNFFKKI
jgi:hypothetical protein